MLVLELNQVIGVTKGVVPVEVRVLGFRSVFQNRLLLLRQRIEFPSVEGDFEAFLGLVEASQVIVLGNILHAEVTVGSRIVELGRIDQAALHRRLNFATRQLNNRQAHFIHNVSRQANGTVLQPLHLGRFTDLFLEPTQRLCRHRAVEEADQVKFQAAHQFVEQVHPAAIMNPAEHFLRRPAKAWAGTEQ